MEHPVDKNIVHEMGPGTVLGLVAVRGSEKCGSSIFRSP